MTKQITKEEEELQESIDNLGHDLIAEIELKKQYREENAQLKKELQQLRADMSEMANKLDSNDIPL